MGRLQARNLIIRIAARVWKDVAASVLEHEAPMAGSKAISGRWGMASIEHLDLGDRIARDRRQGWTDGN